MQPAGKRFSGIRHQAGGMVPPLSDSALKVPGLQWYKGGRTGLQAKELSGRVCAERLFD
jgi:hypothetical protein